ncbi:uncharacterized protein A4U43_C06F12720 [Asparagus officinalis]|uniref:Retinoblastoma-associated protein N-terminal domain-containing protein n=1 Tax=Asparagus officinalis TaxID=4686 RepID=A0A5P1EM43_ASPOF|nr:uncharacterized protein A4U43_C06F12720 [Asparagus officinalis]
MEDVKLEISSRSDEGGAIEARFSNLCKVSTTDHHKLAWYVRYYKRAYQEFFKCNSGSVQHPAVSSSTGYVFDYHRFGWLPSSTGYVSDYHRFGWLLFLALRLHAFGRFKYLVTCTNGLVSILVSCYTA